MILSLVKRNVKIFFRDKMGVFFSLLGPLIMFVLYTVFLGNLQNSGLKEAYGNVNIAGLDNFVNSWVFAGILTIVTITTSLAAIQIFVSDKEKDRFKDFAVSPIKASSIVISYLFSTFIISITMTFIIFILSEIYLVAKGGSWLTGTDLLGTIGALALLCAVFSALSCFIATFIKSVAAFSSLNIIVGTSAGFLAAIYVPIGSLPNTVANFVNILPFSQAASLLRSYFVGVPLDDFANNNAQTIAKLSETYGITINIGSTTLSQFSIILILMTLFLLFTIGAVIQITRKLK